MDRKIEQIAMLFEDVEIVCFVSDTSGKLLWQNTFSATKEFVADANTVYDLFLADQAELSACLKVKEDAAQKFSFPYGSEMVTGSVQHLTGEDGKEYFLWKIFGRKQRLSTPYSGSRKDMMSVGTFYRISIFNIYNVLPILEQCLEESGRYDGIAYLKSIGKNCRKLMKTTINMNEYDSFRNGDPTFRIEAVSLHTLLNGLIGQAGFLLKDSPKRIRFLAEETDLTVQIDLYQFTIAFLNLLANALEFSFSEGEVLIRLRKLGNNALLTVENDGESMQGEMIARAFEPFYSYSPLTDGAKGLGLGLYVANEIIRAMGGSITATARKEGGCTISLRLPLAETGNEQEFRAAEFVREQIVDELSLLYVLLVDSGDFKNF